MSYDPRLASRLANENEEDANARKGSVRAARERLQAAQMQQQLPDRSRIIGLPQRPNQLVSQFSQGREPLQPQPQQQQQQQDSIEKLPSAVPQWPLTNDVDDVLTARPEPRGPPPQRPPRPISEDLPIQSTSPDYRDSFQSDEMFSPTSVTISSRPLTTSSAASETSSLGSIPDFPVPQPPMPTIQPFPRRTPSLGPPPSSRRGPSSYYTQMSYVSPIVEESETRSNTIRSHHGSFASSNVMPNSDDYYLEDDDLRSDDDEDDDDDDDDETITSDYERNSRASDHDDRSELVQSSLLRQASLGRRTRPSLMTITSTENLGDKKGSTTKRKLTPPEAGAGAAAAGIGGAVLAARDGVSAWEPPPPLPQNAAFGDGSGFYNSSSSESLRSLRNLNPYDDEESQRVSDPEKDMLEMMETPVHPLQKAARQTTLADRVGKRRPPRLDVDAVRDAEARGSLTSLPELIRRATRLAANLDRGKTASRLGLDFWESGAPEKNNKVDMRRSGSLSDMLAAFPPPGEATPTGDRTPAPNRASKSVWPSSGNQYDGTGSPGTDQKPSDKEKNKKRRKCCGMPLWTFVTLLIVLLFLIAAAVIIPVVLIVLPKMNNTQNSNTAQGSTGATETPNSTSPQPAAPTASSGSSGQCNGVITCQNNGIAILNADRSCNCVCTNGFTGKTCGTQADAGCTTTNITGANNATVGTGIPRLLESAMNNFGVPLNPSGLLALFSGLSLTCTSENALITFNGLASRSLEPSHPPLFVHRNARPSPTLPLPDVSRSQQTPRTLLRQRQTIGAPGVAQPNKAASAVASAAASATAQAEAQPISSNTTAVDFARVGVLLVLQQSRTLDTAANAQETIQEFLKNNRNGNTNTNKVNLGSFSMDLVKLTIEFSNGTTIQATNI
ncbi:hypothetical protein K504DRAFT_277822 [Pleomassaria siparia CBS 279.74]|uniref:EGF-like domain-containing protein n=1 Tax=Pleomassaria siparia CBS 279.74 TaxID=1314801 RepID=A0A6G1KAX3_9PLEO|nr:hypothetical protein K504DRAFT_277822 [Pleomassaria siparia CBS 279.74]